MVDKATPTFIELTIVESDLTNVPVPRKGLVDITLIASLEDLGDRDPLRSRCRVTLHEAAKSYETLAAVLAKHATVVRPP